MRARRYPSIMNLFYWSHSRRSPLPPLVLLVSVVYVLPRSSTFSQSLFPFLLSLSLSLFLSLTPLVVPQSLTLLLVIPLTRVSSSSAPKHALSHVRRPFKDRFLSHTAHTRSISSTRCLETGHSTLSHVRQCVSLLSSPLYSRSLAFSLSTRIRCLSHSFSL